jgi:4-hydroxy-2-oxovalerate aldolase
MMNNSNVDILECTLRDGSYAVNFQFSAVETQAIASALDKAGFKYIEVGHGIGLGASAAGMGVAAETDEGYMIATASAVKSGKWGMFCIPGIATLDDVDLAAKHGMDFIRIGTDVSNTASALPFVERAKQHGMFVAVNFMKSYAVDPAYFASKALEARSSGADMVYVVDSAGGMLPSDLDAYFGAIREVSDVPMGFHGHANLGLSVSNAIRAIELGATVVDTSLQGFGRSSGNTPTELLLLVLLRQNIDLGIDPFDVLDIGETHIKPLMRSAGNNSIDSISGYAQFHSSYMGIIWEMSTKYRVDPRRLIVDICEIDKINADPSMVEDAALKLSEKDATQRDAGSLRFRLDQYFGDEQHPPKNSKN